MFIQFFKKFSSALILVSVLSLNFSLYSAHLNIANANTDAQILKASENFDEKLKTSTQEQLSSFGSCYATNKTNKTSCKQNGDNSTIKRLYQASENGEIYQMVLEPISDENVTFLAKICNNKPIKNAAGTAFQYIKQGQDNYLILGDTICNDFFVEKCKPNVSQTNKIVKVDTDYKLEEEIETSVYCSRVQIFFGRSGADLLQKYVGGIYKFVASIGAIIAVAIIIVNGIRVTVGETEIAAAKDNIVRSLTALAVLFLASVILNAVNPNFFQAEITETSTPTESSGNPAGSGSG